MHTYGIAITVFTKESACIPWKANESKRYLDCGQPPFAGHNVSSDTALQRGENKTQSSTCEEKKKQPHRAKQMLFSRSRLFYFPFPPRIWEFATQKQTAGNQDISGVISMHTHTHRKPTQKNRKVKNPLQFTWPRDTLHTAWAHQGVLCKAAKGCQLVVCPQHGNWLRVPHRNPQTTAQSPHMEHDSFSHGSHTSFNQSVCRV